MNTKTQATLILIGILVAILAIGTAIAHQVVSRSRNAVTAEIQELSKLPKTRTCQFFIVKNATLQYANAPLSYYEEKTVRVEYDKFVHLAKAGDVVIYCNKGAWLALCGHGGFMYSCYWKSRQPWHYETVGSTYDPITGYVSVRWEREELPVVPNYLSSMMDWTLGIFGIEMVVLVVGAIIWTTKQPNKPDR